MKQIALSIEQMKHLEELGLDISDASMFWYAHIVEYPSRKQSDFNLCVKGFCKYDWDEERCISTYTLQDILEKLPSITYNHEVYVATVGGCNCSYIHCDGGSFNLKVYKSITKTTNIESAYNMLCWCIKNKYIKV